MKHTSWVFWMLVAAVVAAGPRQGQAATQEEINNSVEKGVAWLASQQHANGAFGDGGSGSHDVGDTGLAVATLVDHAKHLDLDPFSPAYAYSTQVVSGLNFIFRQAQRSGGQVSWPGSHGSYVWGPAVMAITAPTQKNRVVDDPGSVLNGMTYLQVVQEALAHIEAVQYTTGYGLGFWSYNPSYDFGDMSATGWVTMGLGYASFNFDIILSPAMLTRLSQGIDLAQWVGDSSDPRYGGAGYISYSSGYPDWINLYKAGHLLYMLYLVGDESNSVRVQRTLDFINRHWNKPNSGTSGYPSTSNGEYDMGWRGSATSPLPSYIATTTMMKSFILWGLDTIGAGVDWYDEMTDVIVERQDAAGWWDQGGYPTYLREMSTVWALLTMLRAVPATGSITDITTTTANFTAESDTTGTGYYVVLPRNASAPSAAQIKAGTDGAGVAAVTSGQGAITGGVPRVYGLKGLSADTRYDLYFVNETAPDEFSNVVRVQFATLSLGSVIDASSLLDLSIVKWALNYDTGALIATVRAEYLAQSTNTKESSSLKPELHSTFWFAMADDANNKLERKDGVTALGTPYTDVTTAFTDALQASYGRVTMVEGDAVTFTVGIFSRNRVPPPAAVYALWADPPVHAVDTNADGVVDDFEILAAVDDWYAGKVGDSDFLTAMDLWRAGSSR